MDDWLIEVIGLSMEVVAVADAGTVTAIRLINVYNENTGHFVTCNL